MFKKNGTVNGRQICENALWTHCPIFIEHEYVGKCASRSIILDKVNDFGGGGDRNAEISAISIAKLDWLATSDGKSHRDDPPLVGKLSTSTIQWTPYRTGRFCFLTQL